MRQRCEQQDKLLNAGECYRWAMNLQLRINFATFTPASAAAFCIYTTDPEMQWQIHQVYAMGSISNHYDWFVMQGVITLLVELDYCGFCLSRILLYFPLPKRACLPPSGGVTSQISPMYIVIYAICILWVGFSNWMNISLNWIQPNSIFSISDKKNNFGHWLF